VSYGPPRGSPTEEETPNNCPECGCRKLITDQMEGEKICSKCGYVIDNTKINMAPEWRAFTVEERRNKSRVGTPFSYAISDKGLSTTIGNVYSERSTRKLSRERKFQLLRISKWQRRAVKSSHQRNLTKAMTILAQICDKLHIPRNVKEQAALVYRKALKKELLRGRSIETIVAASLYAACRMTKTQRNLREVAEKCTIEPKEVAKNYRLIYRELSLSVPRPRAQNKVPKIAAKAKIGQKIQQHAVEILRTAEREKITAGKDPTGLAAAALYIACRKSEQKFTQKQIATAAGVTEVTIRNRYKGIKEKLNIQF